MKIIASNFKTNNSRQYTSLYVNKLNEHLKKNKILNDIFIFPSATALDKFNTVSNIHVGAQNAYPVKNGSFTGEIGSSHLDEFNIKTILLGHSERRHILRENQDEISKKYEFYKNLGYKIIYCIGEPLNIKNQGISKILEYIHKQFLNIDLNYDNLILAYEPVWAIGTGISATNEDIENIHTKIKEKINKPILYGGSVKIDNVAKICQIKNVDGVLIGTASWEISDFIKIIDLIKNI